MEAARRKSQSMPWCGSRAASRDACAKAHSSCSLNDRPTLQDLLEVRQAFGQSGARREGLVRRARARFDSGARHRTDAPRVRRWHRLGPRAPADPTHVQRRGLKNLQPLAADPPDTARLA
jgi:hypothetical protein